MHKDPEQELEANRTVSAHMCVTWQAAKANKPPPTMCNGVFGLTATGSTRKMQRIMIIVLRVVMLCSHHNSYRYFFGS